MVAHMNLIVCVVTTLQSEAKAGDERGAAGPAAPLPPGGAQLWPESSSPSMTTTLSFSSSRTSTVLPSGLVTSTS
jgi:hypothetical protein